MTSLVLRKTLTKFTRPNLEEYVKKWRFVSENDIFNKINWKFGSKYEVIWQVSRLCVKKNVSIQDVAEVDLLYIQEHSSSKKWCVHKLKKVKGNSNKKTVLVPEEFVDVIDEALNNFFDVVVSLKKHKDAFWLRLHFDAESENFRPTDIVYMVYYPQTDYVLLTLMKVAHRDAILQALQVALGCTEVTEMKLSGKSVTSLIQLAVNTDGKGSFSKFKSKQIDANPLSVRQQQKRKVPTEDDDGTIHITDENIAQKRRRLDILLDIFGHNEQPQLEKVEFRMDTKFRGMKHAPGMREREDPFRCRVKFEGASVLEGIRKLAEHGILDPKMPHHLKNLQSMGKNQITLAEKENAE